MATYGMAGVGGFSSGLDFDTVANAMSSALASSEANITSLIASSGTNASTTDLLNLQVAIQKWTLVSNIQSTVVKDLGDALKGIIQKAS